MPYTAYYGSPIHFPVSRSGYIAATTQLFVAVKPLIKCFIMLILWESFSI